MIWDICKGRKNVLFYREKIIPSVASWVKEWWKKRDYALSYLIICPLYHSKDP